MKKQLGSMFSNDRVPESCFGSAHHNSYTLEGSRRILGGT